MIQKNNGMPASVWAATLGGIGYWRGSGTLASLCIIPYVFLVQYGGVSLGLQAMMLALFAIASFIIIARALPYCKSKDPSEIVLDECVGMVLAVYALPFTWFMLVLGFLVFRVLDISKFFGLSRFERLPGAWGILLDDVAAACLTNLMLRLLLPLACYS